MTDATADAFCILCPDRERIPNRPPVCDACRTWLPNAIGDLGRLVVQHAARLNIAGDPRVMAIRDRRPTRDADDNYVPPPADKDERGRLLPLPPVRRPDGSLVLHYRDPVAAVVPTSGNLRGTGPLPIDVDAVDIMLPAREGSRGPHARGFIGADPDQEGHLPLSTVLDGWVREWRKQRQKGERLPDINVGELCTWLRARVDWAFDEYDLVDVFADDIRTYRTTLRGMLGLINVPLWKRDVPCPKCHHYSLNQPYGDASYGRLWIECAECPTILSPEEYADWARTLIARQREWMAKQRAKQRRDDARNAQQAETTREPSLQE